jgi:hypothetical protein
LGSFNSTVGWRLVAPSTARAIINNHVSQHFDQLSLLRLILRHFALSDAQGTGELNSYYFLDL